MVYTKSNLLFLDHPSQGIKAGYLNRSIQHKDDGCFKWQLGDCIPFPYSWLTSLNDDSTVHHWDQILAFGSDPSWHQRWALFCYPYCKWFYLCALAVLPNIFPYLSILSHTWGPSLTRSCSHLNHLTCFSQFDLSFRSSSNPISHERVFLSLMIMSFC